jgi:hypothetical protein
MTIHATNVPDWYKIAHPTHAKQKKTRKTPTSNIPHLRKHQNHIHTTKPQEGILQLDAQTQSTSLD